ncbi:MAG: tetraacyldisaccharide 4'-kinase [Bacteroidota bacterium]|nr:tetraacyldisaccharide 4'-kinase [Bacteroidota bacterium]
MNIIRIILYPVALLYGFVMFVRNKLFDWDVLPSESFEIPVISVGNLSVGGTGKTPTVELIIRILKETKKIATLSRGYGRQTRGFALASKDSSYLEIGDEPLQYSQKFEEIQVAVDENRRRGLHTILEKEPDLDVVILDDAFQHRSVKPGLSILLTDFHNLYVNDFVLPSGGLREFRRGSGRADIIIITKTPCVLSPITRRRINSLIKPGDQQELFFSFIAYKPIRAIPGIHNHFEKKKTNTILLFCGIANSYPIQDHLKTKCEELIVMEFPDHHKYNKKDMEKVIKTYRDIFSANKAIITTEKDAMRLIKTKLIDVLLDLPVFYLPIEMRLHKGDSEKFEKKIINYVEENRRKRPVSEKQDRHQT